MSAALLSGNTADRNGGFGLRQVVLGAVLLVLAACGGAKLPPPPDAEILDETQTVAVGLPSRPAESRSYSAMVVNLNSGRILHKENADEPRYPASLTKMMTLFLVFEDIKAGRLSMSDSLWISENAARQPPAKIGVKAGDTISVRDAVSAMSVKSANDVAVVIAENLSGSERAFANRMTQMARTIGMTKTRFVNASGLPDNRQVTTARDMAILGRALKKRHPRLSKSFASREFVYDGRRFRATNRLLGKVQGVDGIKTGYIRAAGYNLVASAKRGRTGVIVVVIGERSGKARNDAVEALIERYL